MKTINQKLNIIKVLEEAIQIIDQAVQGITPLSITHTDIRAIYNKNCDNQIHLTSTEYELATTIAIGAITQQNGSNIQAIAAITDIENLIDDLNHN